ncbi:hypothetical protein K501DRAFT_284127 [Backusella circina FSU 941]|nr:hypothetical protein K501DRAFT_284127 [Backusella circina FSU 941]
MKTCRRLHDIISNSNLFENVLINKDKQHTESIVLRFVEYPHYGKQVKHLNITLSELSSPVFRILPLIFPNLQELLNRGFLEVQRTDADVQPFILWKDTLVRYDFDEGYRPIVHFLERVTFPYLVYLAISPYVGDAEKVSKYEVNIFECFQNAPSLKELKLSRCEITLSFLERMHKVCPKLRKLSVNEVIMMTTDKDVLPQKIVPATLFEYLNLSGDVSILDKQCLFLDYFLLKYPNLRNLDIITPFYDRDLGVAIEILYENERFNALRDHRREDDIDEDEDDDEDDGFYESKQAELKASHKAYLHEGSRFLNKLPSTLRRLKLDPIMFTNIMEELDQANLNLTELYFYDQPEYTNIIKNPQELCYFTKMTTLKKLTTVLGSSIQEYNGDVVSNSVTEMEVRIDGITSHREMDLGWILSNFPSLRHLDIEKSGVAIVAREPREGESYPYLCKLGLFKCYIHPSVIKYLNVVAPNLLSVAWSILGDRFLEVEDRGYRGTSFYDYLDQPGIEPNHHDIIDFTSRDLLEFHLSTVLDKNPLTKKRDCLLEIQTKRGTKKFIYTDSFIKGPQLEKEITNKNDLPPKKEKKMRKITLKCDDVKLFNINAMLELKLD